MTPRINLIRISSQLCTLSDTTMQRMTTILILAVASFLFLQRSSVATADPVASTHATAEAPWPTNNSTVTLDLAHGRNLLYAKAAINGEPVGYLLVDTGTSVTTIFRDTTLAGQLHSYGTFHVHSEGTKLARDVTVVRSLKLGTLELKSKMLFLSNDSSFATPTGEKIIGILGMDVLGQFPISLDFRLCKLIFFDPVKFTAPANAREFHLQPEWSTPRIQANLEGHQGWFILDSGHPGSVEISSHFMLSNLELILGRPNTHEATPWGAPAEQYKVRWKSFQFLGRKLQEENGVYCVHSGPDTAAGLIGATHLRDSVVTIDMRHLGVWLNQPEPEPLEDLTVRLAAPSWKDLTGTTPLMWAEMAGREDAVETLLARGANPNIADMYQVTPLMVAAARGEKRAIKALVKHGARIDARSLFDGYTPLGYAAVNGRTEAVRLLLEASASANVALDSGRTPLFLAGEEGHAEVVHELIKHGAEIDRPLVTGETPLIAACRNGNLECARLLVERGASVNVASTSGTPLTWAAGSGYPECVRLLLKEAADPNRTDLTGRTPLSWAAGAYRGVVCVKVLLDAHADPAIKDKRDKLPLDYALETGSPETIQMLVGRVTRE